MGFGDVNALAWRLPLALAGDVTHLDEYSAERTHVVTRTLQALTPVSLFMTSADETSKALRREVMSLLPEVPGLRELIDGHAAAHISDFPLGPAESGVVGRPIRDLQVTTAAGDERYLTELLPDSQFSIERLAGPSGGHGTAALLLRHEGMRNTASLATDCVATQILWAEDMAVRDRLGLSTAGDVLLGRPDRVVYTESPVAVDSADHPPHSDLQRVFVELSESMSILGVDGLSSGAARDSLRTAALEGAAS